MPASQGSMAMPALRAYAQVLLDGTTPNLNSGVTVVRTATGIYEITLPANLGITDGRELVIIQAKNDGTDDLISGIYRVVSATLIEVTMWQGVVVQHINTAFNFFLFSTTLPSELD